MNEVVQYFYAHLMLSNPFDAVATVYSYFKNSEYDWMCV